MTLPNTFQTPIVKLERRLTWSTERDAWRIRAMQPNGLAVVDVTKDAARDFLDVQTTDRADLEKLVLADFGRFERYVASLELCHWPRGYGITPVFACHAEQAEPRVRDQLVHRRHYDDPAAYMRLAMAKTPPSEQTRLTTPQRRELEEVANAPSGCLESKGAHWAVRARLQSAGLLELRRMPEIRLGGRTTRPEANRWFITQAGRAAL